MKLASYLVLWTLACQAAAGFDEKETAIVPEENANEHLRGLWWNCDRQCCGKRDGHHCHIYNDKCVLDAECQDHYCTATSTVVCDPPAECKLPGECDPLSGKCNYASVQDGMPCISDDKCATLTECSDGNCIVTATKTCPEPTNQCAYSTGCDPLSGECFYASRPNGYPCALADDKCVEGAECQEGTCVATVLKICDAPAQCKQPGVCDSSTGDCTYANLPNGEPCDDGNDETTDDHCEEGVCKCGAGKCCGQPDNTKCNMGDGNKCLKQSHCEAERCVAGPLKVCRAPNDCKDTSPCDPATGFCTYTFKPDGTPCNDHNKATKIDQCQSGFCVGQ